VRKCIVRGLENHPCLTFKALIKVSRCLIQTLPLREAAARAGTVIRRVDVLSEEQETMNPQTIQPISNSQQLIKWLNDFYRRHDRRLRPWTTCWRRSCRIDDCLWRSLTVSVWPEGHAAHTLHFCVAASR